MSKLITQEIAIVIAVPVEDPTMLNENFLKQAGIIPIDWQLEREPVYSDRVAQIMFTNGVSIVAQPDRLMFLEIVGDKSSEALHAGEVAQKYLATLKMADYRSVSTSAAMPHKIVPMLPQHISIMNCLLLAIGSNTIIVKCAHPSISTTI
jgi:hypothetical protein